MSLRHHAAAFTLDTYVHLLSDELPDADFLDDVAKVGCSVEANDFAR